MTDQEKITAELSTALKNGDNETAEKVARKALESGIKPLDIIQKILVPVELVEETVPEAEYATAVAAQLGAELVLCAVIDTPTAASMIVAVSRSCGSAGNSERSIFTQSIGSAESFDRLE